MPCGWIVHGDWVFLRIAFGIRHLEFSSRCIPGSIHVLRRKLQRSHFPPKCRDAIWGDKQADQLLVHNGFSRIQYLQAPHWQHITMKYYFERAKYLLPSIKYAMPRIQEPFLLRRAQKQLSNKTCNQESNLHNVSVNNGKIAGFVLDSIHEIQGSHGFTMWKQDSQKGGGICSVRILGISVHK